jgi:hypothetical protein
MGRRKRPPSIPLRPRPYAIGGSSPKNPTPESTTLAPTDVDELFVRLMPIRADKSAHTEGGISLLKAIIQRVGPDEFGKWHKLIGGEDGGSAGIMHCARWSLVVLPPPQRSSSAIFLGGCRLALKALCLRASIPGRDARLLTACVGPGAYVPRGW